MSDGRSAVGGSAVTSPSSSAPSTSRSGSSFSGSTLATRRLLRNSALACPARSALRPRRRQRADSPLPAFWSVLLTNAFDQGCDSRWTRPPHELLYLPIAAADRGRVKNAIEIVLSGIADALVLSAWGCDAGILRLPGPRSRPPCIAALNTCVLAPGLPSPGGFAPATPDDSREHPQHRIDRDACLRAASICPPPRLLRASSAPPITEVRYAAGADRRAAEQTWHPALRALLNPSGGEIRRRALALLSAGNDKEIAARRR